jgi:hypothetical protein
MSPTMSDRSEEFSAALNAEAEAVLGRHYVLDAEARDLLSKLVLEAADRVAAAPDPDAALVEARTVFRQLVQTTVDANPAILKSTEPVLITAWSLRDFCRRFCPNLFLWCCD